MSKVGLQCVTGNSPEDVCEQVNKLGVTPVSIHPVAGTKRVVAYYVGEKPEYKDPKAGWEKPKPEPAEAAKDEAAYEVALGNGSEALAKEAPTEKLQSASKPQKRTGKKKARK